jgi:hypothetical protein
MSASTRVRVERRNTIDRWLPQPYTLKMEPFSSTAVHIAGHHLTIADAVAIAVSRLILFFIIALVSSEVYRG